MIRRRAVLTLALCFAPSLLLAEGGGALRGAGSLPVVSPEAVGLSAERLARLPAVMQRYVDEGRVAGIVTYVARGGKIAHLQAYGNADREQHRAMEKDTIVRIASMSKALTSVAAMMLVEEGAIRLQDPVSRFIPEFRRTTVAVAPTEGSPAGTPYTVVPAKRAITIRDLLTHTAGISYGEGLSADAWKAAGIQGWYFAERNEPVASIVRRMAALPMDAQPGEKFVYGYNTDILGVVVETVSGQTLDEFFKQRVTGPLGMVDTSFYLPGEKRARLAAVYSAKDDGSVERAPDPGKGQGAYIEGPRVAFSGGAGLLSTAKDYGRLLQMLLNGGELDGVRLLGPKTIELMTVNHVGSLFRGGELGFGLGFSVTVDLGKAGRHGTVGDYGWGGAYFTNYFIDPDEKLVAVYLSQVLPAGSLDLEAKFRTLVYQSIVGPPTVGAPLARRR